MIQDMDILLMDNGQLYLTVPGKIPEGLLSIQLHSELLQLFSAGIMIAEIDDVPEEALSAIARHGLVNGKIGLIEIIDSNHPPAHVTHWAIVDDQRH